jgi:hypothetical protein
MKTKPDYCKFCGCADPLGKLPDKLSRDEMKIIMKRLNIPAKQLLGIVCDSTHSIYEMLRGGAFDEVERKLSNYLLKLLREQKGTDVK